MKSQEVSFSAVPRALHSRAPSSLGNVPYTHAALALALPLPPRTFFQSRLTGAVVMDYTPLLGAARGARSTSGSGGAVFEQVPLSEAGPVACPVSWHAAQKLYVFRKLEPLAS